MAIIFAILKTILKILLIILALIILLILLILFVPFRYRAAGVKEPGTIEAQASVTWLLHMLTVEVGYELSSGKGLTKDIRLFGISIFKVKSWLDERRKSKAEKEREKRKQEKRQKLERMKTEDPERYEQLRAEALARKEEKRKAEEERKRLEEEKRRMEAEKAAQEALKKKQEEERIRLEKEKAEAERIRLEAEKAEEERIRSEAVKAKEGIRPEEAETQESESRNAPKPKPKDIIEQKARNIYLKVLENILKIVSKLLQFALNLIVRIWHLPGKIISVISNICRKIGAVGDKAGKITGKISDILDFLQDEHTQEVLSLLKKQIGRLFGHILPKKLKGYIQFGLSDPYMTGRVLATACAFYPLYGKTFRLEPDFEELVFNGRAELKGRVYLFYLAFIALSTYFNKNTKYVINYIKSFRNKEEAE